LPLALQDPYFITTELQSCSADVLYSSSVPAAVHPREAGVHAVEIEGPVLSVGVGAHLEVRDNVCGKETGQNLKVSTVFKYCMHLYIPSAHEFIISMFILLLYLNTVFGKFDFIFDRNLVFESGD
jgi:hypothetical protein